MKYSSWLSMLTLALVILGCRSQLEERAIAPSINTKICGVSFEGPPKKIDPAVISTIDSVSANAISLMPYAYMANLSDPNLTVNPNWQWWGESKAGISSCIKIAHQQGKTVMVKPHIWVQAGEFTGQIDMKSESDWNTFESKYASYILNYAHLCDSLNAEVFCIGTELNTFAKKRPLFWASLIDTVRAIYSGKLTYAENWDVYQTVPFWSDLDYIGVDAYFPLSDARIETVENLKKAWQPYIENLLLLSDSLDKRILFTEFGYRSIDYCSESPWDSKTQRGHNELTQSNALEALLLTFWHEDWIAGGYLWKWFSKPKLTETDNSFTVQGKLASKTVNKFYK